MFRALSLLLGAAFLLAGASDRETERVSRLTVPEGELSLAADTAVLMDSADALIARHSAMGLVTVDSTGRPRVLR